MHRGFVRNWVNFFFFPFFPQSFFSQLKSQRLNQQSSNIICVSHCVLYCGAWMAYYRPYSVPAILSFAKRERRVSLLLWGHRWCVCRQSHYVRAHASFEIRLLSFTAFRIHGMFLSHTHTQSEASCLRVFQFYHFFTRRRVWVCVLTWCVHTFFFFFCSLESTMHQAIAVAGISQRCAFGFYFIHFFA